MNEVIRKLEVLDLLVTGARERSLALERMVVNLYIDDMMSGQEYSDIMGIYPRLRDAQHLLDHSLRQERERIEHTARNTEGTQIHSGNDKDRERGHAERGGNSNDAIDQEAAEVQP